MAFPLESKRWQFCLVNMQMSWYLRKRICPTNGVAHDLCETINAAPPYFFFLAKNISSINDIIAIFIYFQGSLTYNGTEPKIACRWIWEMQIYAWLLRKSDWSRLVSRFVPFQRVLFKFGGCKVLSFRECIMLRKWNGNCINSTCDILCNA